MIDSSLYVQELFIRQRDRVFKVCVYIYLAVEILVLAGVFRGTIGSATVLGRDVVSYRSWGEFLTWQGIVFVPVFIAEILEGMFGTEKRVVNALAKTLREMCSLSVTWSFGIGGFVLVVGCELDGVRQMICGLLFLMMMVYGFTGLLVIVEERCREYQMLWEISDGDDDF